MTFVYIRYMCRFYTHDTFDTYDRDGEGGALVIDEPVLQREGGTVNSVTRFGKILPLR